MAVSAPFPFNFPLGLTAPQPFYLSVDRDFIEQTQIKVKTWRSPVALHSNWTNEGPPPDLLQDVAQYWGNEYDWPSVEVSLNHKGNHYATSVPIEGNYSASVSLHFVHQQSTNPDAIPLLLLHGWPSTHLEWSKVIEPLVNDDKTPFHVVAPDLPGFGFSPAPTKPGLGPRQNALVMDGLMKQLGYSKYGVASTDLGWQIAMWMVRDVESSIIGHITDFFAVSPTDDDLSRFAQNKSTKEEKAYISASNDWYTSHSAYSTINAQKPLTLSYGLGDSPVGLLAYIWDLMHMISDGYKYSYEELITDAFMLYMPGPYSNIRSYLEAYKSGMMDFHKNDVPTGVSQWNNANGPFPELASAQLPPRAWIERSSNLVYFAKHSVGGHFPAVSQPRKWVKDVRTFFSSVVQSK
ncbi:epoxide hydrolase [Fusarium heterosporum]|uniref:Epoxide hydrolase n=1 Tax=Fusarium heterosporum TaxID=42747 RepID=A0A8H5T9F9_FUSHE|nr:epoxide hydrolase [Fusarium heterosporum]